MRKFSAVTLLFFVWAMTLSAQETKNELAGTIGRTFISDQTPPNTNFFDNTVHFGHGTSFAVNYARHLKSYRWGLLSAELPVIFNPDEDLNYGLNQIPREYSSIFITPSARVNFIPDLAFSPWVSFGGGLGHVQASRNLVFFGTNPGPRVKTTGVLQGGVGFDVKVLPRFERLRLRFEARDDWSGAPPLNINTGKSGQHNFYVAAGGVLNF